MQFALVNNERTAPASGLSGSCPACGGSMIARCGQQRVHHWAHRGVRNCDSWWEPETPWHRAWKGWFPEAWQEVILHAPNGEKHIADVRTEHGVTIEFQHSHLRPQEREARERFYGNLYWVVDGSRLVRDLPRFAQGFSSLQTVGKGWHVAPFPDELFPKDWLDCNVPVLFDFEGAVGCSEETVKFTRPLWCLLPGRVSGQAVVLAWSREGFLRNARETAHPLQSRKILNHVARLLSGQHQAARYVVLDAGMMNMLVPQVHARRRFRRRTARF